MAIKSVRRLRLENCEERIALAGDVAASLEGSLLNVFGDQLSNEISIQQNAAGDIRVTGLNGTTVNGAPSALFRAPGLDKLDVRMEGGNDRVTIGRVTSNGDVNVDLGAGADFASVAAQASNSISILGGLGVDQVNVGGASAGSDLFIDTGLNAGRVNVGNTIVGLNATIIGDAVNDIISVNGLTAGGDLSIETKGGNDTVNLANVATLSANVTTDIGADRITATNVRTTEDMSYETGDGADVVTLTNVVSNKNLLINTDSGNDVITTTNVRAAIDAVLVGGAGFDTFDDNGFFGGVKREVVEVERFI